MIKLSPLYFPLDFKDNHRINLNNMGQPTMKTKNQPRMMRMKQLISYTSLSRAYLYQKVAEGELHEGYQISPGVRAWEKSEIDKWLDKKMGK